MPVLSLPDDYTFPKADSSPGPVVFSHQRHIRLNANACTNCHPKPYRMQKTDVATIECEYGRMNGCGHCHNGTQSFDIKEGCRLCHRRADGKAFGPSDQPLSWRLADRLLPAFDRDFGPVFFSHRAHVTVAGIACAECHPAPYRMARTEVGDPGLEDREAYIAWGHRCGVCHDGGRAFAQTERCASCHARWSRDKPRSECTSPECQAAARDRAGDAGPLEMR